MAMVQGGVSATGAIRVAVRSGNEWADGSGRLSGNSGSGVWRGEGTSGTCDGTWVAERRGYDNYAGEIGAPRTVVAQGSQAGRRGGVACQAHFRSYDPTTGTYLGYDGVRHQFR